MKTSIPRYTRRQRTPSPKGNFFKSDLSSDLSFFGESTHDTFFQPTIQRKCEACEKEKKLQRVTEENEEEEEQLQAQLNKSSTASGKNISTYVSNLSGRGQSLPTSANHFFSSKMGYDFGNVKIHSDQEASESAKAINAKAYTVGNNIVFNSGQFDAESQAGKKLLTHELTHVMQQNNASVQKLQMQAENEDSISGLESVEEIEEEAAAEEEEFIEEPVSIPNITTYGNPSRDTAFANSVRFSGKTDADFDGGIGETKDLKAVKSKNCEGCSGSDCLNITGTFEITYTVTTTVSLPDVPEGLTQCQYKRVKDAIDNKIAPHEQQHVSAYKTYNGKVRFPINYTGCQDGFQQYLQDINDADGIKRKAAAKAKSDALDPFIVNVDLDCTDPTPPKK